MNTKTQKILIITAIVLLVLALGAVLFLIIDSMPKKESSPVEAEHQAEENLYDENGQLVSTLYYDDDNNYTGRKDYVYDEDKDYIFTYDENDKKIALEVTEKNEQGKTVSYKKTENEKTVKEEEYTYADNGYILEKAVKKTYSEDGVETAVKLFYEADGETVKEKIKYIDGKEVARETFDD